MNRLSDKIKAGIISHKDALKELIAIEDTLHSLANECQVIIADREVDFIKQCNECPLKREI